MEERGQYITILCLLHQHGGYIPKDRLEVAVGKISDQVLPKLQENEQGLYNQRLIDEASKRANFCQSRKKNLDKDTHMARHMEPHMERHMENVNEDINKDIRDKRKEKIIPTHPPFVYIDNDNLKTFYTDYGKTIINEYIQKINDYLSSTGKKPYKDYPATLRNWLRKDGIKKQPKPINAETERPPEITEEQRQANLKMIAEFKSRVGGKV
jgi:hypothetical protein